MPVLSMSEDAIYQQIITETQLADQEGLLELPSRDVRPNPVSHTIDPQTVPNYVPQEQQIKIHNLPPQPSHHKATTLFDDFQVPILMSIVYFIFQMPFMDNVWRTYFPFFFQSNGSILLVGSIFISIMYSVGVYLVTKSIHYISDTV